MLIIDNKDELNALLKLLVTMKFDTPPEISSQFAGSPLIAEVIEKTYLATIESFRKYHQASWAIGLEKELSENHESVITAIEKIIDFEKKRWGSPTEEQKREYITTLTRPYKIDNEVFEYLLKRFDEEV